MSTSVYAQQLEEISREMGTLSLRSSLTAQEDRRMTYLTSQAATFRSLIAAEVGNVETRETRKSQPTEERQMVRRMLANEGFAETRTYTPMQSANSPYVPQGFVKKLVEAQMSAGPLFAGSPILTDVSGGETGPTKIPVMDDTSTQGYVQTEDSTETDINPAALSNVTSTLTRFSSGMILYSMELAQDVTTFDSFTGILANALGKRLGRIQNSTFLASVMTALGANSSAAVSSVTSGVIGYEDVVGLVSEVNAAYRSSAGAGFLMNSSTALALSKIEGNDLRPIFREILAPQPKLLGYPVHISDYADSIATGNRPVVFGDFSTLCARATDLEIKVFTERFVDQGSYALLARRRSDIKYAVQSTSDSALKYISVS